VVAGAGAAQATVTPTGKIAIVRAAAKAFRGVRRTGGGLNMADKLLSVIAWLSRAWLGVRSQLMVAMLALTEGLQRLRHRHPVPQGRAPAQGDASQ
jgi:hypothetical protein